jgi:hypothetical protein
MRYTDWTSGDPVERQWPADGPELRNRQEPLSNFRRDVAAEDEIGYRAELEAKRIRWRGSIRVAWLARRILRRQDREVRR